MILSNTRNVHMDLEREEVDWIIMGKFFPILKSSLFLEPLVLFTVIPIMFISSNHYEGCWYRHHCVNPFPLKVHRLRGKGIEE